MILFYLSIVACVVCILLLIALAVTDHRFYILPNEMVLGLAVSALTFHISTDWIFISIEDAILGFIAGMGLLLVVRMAGNYFLKTEDSVGLGDIKLMGAVGIWLGFPNVMMVFILGGGLGILHGVILRYSLLLVARKNNEIKVPKLAMVNIPAGVGLSIATIAVFFYVFGKWWEYV